MTSAAKILYMIGIILCGVVIFVSLVSAIVAAVSADFVNELLAGPASSVRGALYLFFSAFGAATPASAVVIVMTALFAVYLIDLILSIICYSCLAGGKTTPALHIAAIVLGVLSASFITAAAGVFAIVAVRRAGKER